RFGMRFHPILHRYKLHTGVDIAAPTGTPVFAAAAGEVVHAGYWGAYGNAVIIDHGGGVTTLYGHLSRINCRVGATVNKGQHVGAVGNTGWSTGSHLHFEKRRNGQPVSPM
ncbi:MAG: M23 family metallopeptidase, partial [Armatimonadetes bacterium]|nr:M23 family metallopeptidase [Armatimonadota bacterium]